MHAVDVSCSHCQSPLSSAEASVFLRTGKWGEVKSKREEPGENRNESAWGTRPSTGASAEERGQSHMQHFSTADIVTPQAVELTGWS